MPNLKDYRNSIASVKSTKKITSAMKMVAASKLRRAQEQAEAGQPYAERMAAMLSRLAESVKDSPDAPALLAGTGKNHTHLLSVVTSDRGLCGGFNGAAVRFARQKIAQLLQDGKQVKIITVGRKARDLLKRDFDAIIIESFAELGKPRLSFADADKIGAKILAQFEAGEFDVCTVIYNRFKSVIAQIPSAMQLIPLPLAPVAANTNESQAEAGLKPLYEFEPDEETILTSLLPRNVSVQLYRALLDSAAGEQAARMTAMDNATRNAGDMINRLTLRYNRARQAYITKELIEIISGAAAV